MLEALHFAESDASKIAEVLKAQFLADTTVILGPQATKNFIIESIVQVLANIKEDDRFILYYAGHGFSEYQKNYLSAYDTTSDAKIETCLDLQASIIGPLLDSGCKNSILFLDACASDVHKGYRSAHGAINPRYMDYRTGSHLVFLSCSFGEKSKEMESVGGVWTHFLTKALSGKADFFLKKGRYKVEDAKLQRYLKQEVQKFIKQNARKPTDQTPRLRSDASGVTVLLDYPVDEAKESREAKVFPTSVMDEQGRKDPSAPVSWGVHTHSGKNEQLEVGKRYRTKNPDGQIIEFAIDGGYLQTDTTLPNGTINSIKIDPKGGTEGFIPNLHEYTLTVPPELVVFVNETPMLDGNSLIAFKLKYGWNLNLIVNAKGELLHFDGKFNQYRYDPHAKTIIILPPAEITELI